MALTYLQFQEYAAMASALVMPGAADIEFDPPRIAP